MRLRGVWISAITLLQFQTPQKSYTALILTNRSLSVIEIRQRLGGAAS